VILSYFRFLARQNFGCKFESPPLNRRMFMCSTALLGLSIAGVNPLNKYSSASDLKGYICDILNSACTDHKSTIYIGNRCLTDRPKAARDAEIYFLDQARMFAPSDHEIEQDKKRFKFLLKSQIDQDFIDGNVTQIDGWIISRSEELYCSTVAWADSKFFSYVA
jgi:hypothetical protein